MQMQQTIGELKADVRHLTAASEKQSKKLDHISHVIFAAGAVLLVVLSVGGYMLNKIWDGQVLLLTRGASMPAPPAPQAPTTKKE